MVAAAYSNPHFSARIAFSIRSYASLIVYASTSSPLPRGIAPQTPALRSPLAASAAGVVLGRITLHCGFKQFAPSRSLALRQEIVELRPMPH